jgi:hypothetical protein
LRFRKAEPSGNYSATRHWRAFDIGEHHHEHYGGGAVAFAKEGHELRHAIGEQLSVAGSLHRGSRKSPFRGFRDRVVRGNEYGFGGSAYSSTSRGPKSTSKAIF